MLGQAAAPRLLIPLYIQPGEEVKSCPVWHFPSRYPENTSQYLAGSAALLGDVGVGSCEALAPYGLGRNAKARVFPVLVPKQPRSVPSNWQRGNEESALSSGTASVQLDCIWVTHMIQQELSAQLSLRVLSCAPVCGSWHMPHHLAWMALSLGQVVPARQRQDFVQRSCCQTWWC